mmetsp:Transcript_17703/g.21475  ORF Transcript_17703/g.21475 Transcript_17703/m.21475 type:complete len:209 (-) Transcript_17703:262-888(-)
MVTEKPILRGLFKISEGRLVWSGKWAMSSQKFKEGEKSKFKFIFTGDFGGDKVEAKDGVYKGYFLLKDASADGGYTKVPEKKVKLKFVKIDDAEMFEVEGTGSNKFGEFKLQGKYDPKSNKMALEKEYKQAEDDEDEDGEFNADVYDEEEDEQIDDDGDDIDKSEELAKLNEEANMSVEELRKRYYGGSAANEEASEGSSSKKAKTDE